MALQEGEAIRLEPSAAGAAGINKGALCYRGVFIGVMSRAGSSYVHLMGVMFEIKTLWFAIWTSVDFCVLKRQKDIFLKFCSASKDTHTYET